MGICVAFDASVRTTRVRHDEATSADARAQTILQAFLDRNHIAAARMAREAKVSSRQMTRWRQAPWPNIGLEQMIRLLRAARRITGNPVRMDELFDLDPQHWSLPE